MKKQDICYYIFWAILMIGKGLGWDSSIPIFRYMTFLAIPFAGVKILYSKWTRKELVICVLMNLVGLLVWYKGDSTDILLSTIAITACKDIDIYKIFKVTLWIRGGLFVMLTSLSILGFIESQESIRSYEDLRIRYALGYGHPNATHYTLFIIIVLVLLVYHHRMRLRHYVLLFSYNMFIYYYTISRTGVMMCSLMLVIAFLIDKRKEILVRNGIKYFGNYVYLLIVIISLILTFLYDKVAWVQSFGTFSSRFLTANYIMNSSSLSLFGIPNVVTDFGIIEILYGKGIIVFIFYIISMTLLIRKFIRCKMYIEVSVFIVYAVYALSESYSSSILMNISLFFISQMIYSTNERNKYTEYL